MVDKCRQIPFNQLIPNPTEGCLLRLLLPTPMYDIFEQKQLEKKIRLDFATGKSLVGAQSYSFVTKFWLTIFINPLLQNITSHMKAGTAPCGTILRYSQSFCHQSVQTFISPSPPQNHVQSVGGHFLQPSSFQRIPDIPCHVWQGSVGLAPFRDRDVCSWGGGLEGDWMRTSQVLPSLPSLLFLEHWHSPLKLRRHLVEIIWTPRVYESGGFTKQFLLTSIMIRNELHTFLLIYPRIFTPLLSSHLPIEKNGASHILDNDSAMKCAAKTAAAWGFVRTCF